MANPIYDVVINSLPERYRISLSVPVYGEFPCLPVVGDIVLYETVQGQRELVIQSVFSRRSCLFVKAKNSSRFFRSFYVFPISILQPCCDISNGRVAFALDDTDFRFWKNLCREYRSGVKHG